MSEDIQKVDIQTIMQMSADKRYQHLLSEVKAHQEIWILVDEHGSVMLNTEDEDCVPIWPAKTFAEYWASGEWSHCEAQAIPLKDWLARWTHGLEDDDLFIAVFPNPDEQGLIIDPHMLDEDLRK